MNNYNEKYKIAVYKLSKMQEEFLKKYFLLDDSSNNIFEISELDNYEEKKELIEQPDVLLIDLNEKIDDNLRKYCFDNFIKIVRVTDKPISIITSSDVVLSLSNKLINDELVFLENKGKMTHFEYSINVLKRLAQIANTLKLQYIGENLLDKEFKKSLYEDNNKNVLGLLIKLVYLIDSKDEYTKKHSFNVSKYSVLLGRELNLPEKDLEIIEIGSLLHDIGKIGIPDYILKKPDKLTESEYEIIKRHPIIGEVILPNGDCDLLKQMIRNHHERMDGRGYPDGLKDNEIPFFARILSIADTFDAITTKRSYNEKKNLEEAFNELKRCSKKSVDKNGYISQQLDPYLVDIFIEAIKKEKDIMCIIENDLGIEEEKNKKI